MKKKEKKKKDQTSK